MLEKNESKMKGHSRTEDEKHPGGLPLTEDETDGDLASKNNTTCSYSYFLLQRLQKAFLWLFSIPYRVLQCFGLSVARGSGGVDLFWQSNVFSSPA